MRGREGFFPVFFEKFFGDVGNSRRGVELGVVEDGFFRSNYEVAIGEFLL